MPITANCDVNDISPWVRSAAETRLVPVLGNVFFNDLLLKYNNETLSVDEQALVALIQPCIGWRVAAFVVYSLSRQLKNKGLQIQSGENSEGVALNEVTFGMDQFNQIAAVYQKNMIDFLIENKHLYPIFMSENNNNSSCKSKLSKDSGLEDFNDTIMVL